MEEQDDRMIYELEHLDDVKTPTGLDYSPTALEFCRPQGAQLLVRARGEQLRFAVRWCPTTAHLWLWSGRVVFNHHMRQHLTKGTAALRRDAGLESTKASSAITSILFPPILVVRLLEPLRRGTSHPAAIRS